MAVSTCGATPRIASPRADFRQVSSQACRTVPIVYPPLPEDLREGVSWRSLKYFGAGAIVASVTIASGETIFAARSGALFGYTLLWCFVAGALMKGIQVYSGMRHMVLTGEHPMTHWGYMPGPKNWVPLLIGLLSLFCFPFWQAALPLVLGGFMNWVVGIDGDADQLLLFGRLWATLSIVISVSSALAEKLRILGEDAASDRGPAVGVHFRRDRRGPTRLDRRVDGNGHSHHSQVRLLDPREVSVDRAAADMGGSDHLHRRRGWRHLRLRRLRRLLAREDVGRDRRPPPGARRRHPRTQHPAADRHPCRQSACRAPLVAAGTGRHDDLLCQRAGIHTLLCDSWCTNPASSATGPRRQRLAELSGAVSHRPAPLAALRVSNGHLHGVLRNDLRRVRNLLSHRLRVPDAD